jgi:hypothetical protein
MWFQKPPLGTPLDWGNPLNDETVLALAMNEGHGDKVQDISMNGNHGTLNNFAFPPTVTSGWNPGYKGVGVNSDGVNDYIDCGNNPVLMPSDGLTVSMIIKPAIQSGGSMHIISKRTAATGYYMYMGSVANPSVGFIVKIGGVSKNVSSADLVVDNWYTVSCTHDKKTLRMYVDGVCVHSFAAVGSVDSNTSNLLISDYAGLFYTGAIDQPRMQSRVWSAKEVRDYAINPWGVYLDE